MNKFSLMAVIGIIAFFLASMAHAEVVISSAAQRAVQAEEAATVLAKKTAPLAAPEKSGEKDDEDRYVDCFYLENANHPLCKEQ